MKRNHFNCLLLFVLFQLLAANTPVWGVKPGTWKSYRAYQNATLVAEANHLIFAVYDGSLLSYSPDDQEVYTYGTEDGLNDVRITRMKYFPDEKALLLIYENSNIDIFYGKNDVINMGGIKNKSFENKTINNIELINGRAYLSAAFGVVVIDLKKHEMKDFYNLGTNVKSVAIWGNYIYAASEKGVLKAPLNSNLMDVENWAIDPFGGYPGDSQALEKLVLFKGELFFYQTGGDVWRMDESGRISGYSLPGAILQMELLNDQLVVITADGRIVFCKDLAGTKTAITIPGAERIDSNNHSDRYWIAKWGDGLFGIEKHIDETTYSEILSGLKVNSPLRNYTFFLKYTNGKLLVTGGGKTSNRFNVKGTFMVYEDGKWSSVNDDYISQQTGLLCQDFVSAEVDPRDSHHYFVSSWGEGVYEFQDTTLINRYTYTNTNGSLQTTNPNFYPETYVRVCGLVFDRNNNLFMLNSESKNGLSMLSSNNEWKSFYYTPLTVADPDKIVIARDNRKWINLHRVEGKTGIFVLDDNGTPDNENDDNYAFSSTFVDQQGENIDASRFPSIAEDLDGTIWVGTNNGPVSFKSMDEVRRGVCNRIISTDQYNKGYRLLEGEVITTIAVDGANRKWMGTESNGVYMVENSNGVLSVENFTEENSPLISNKIQSIAINRKSGEIFIATDKGLISYFSEATEGSSSYSNVYAYPNPVRPASHHQVVVTGLMNDSQIKITDIAGNFIREGLSLGGQYIWNCTDRTGTIVRAGIYLVFAALPDGSQGVVTKIMVIK
jgi:hypothetical protein